MSTFFNSNNNNNNNIENKNIYELCSYGNLEEINNLLNSGISLLTQDENGYSPLHAAVSYNQLELIHFLLGYYKDNHENFMNFNEILNLCDNDGDTPLHYCENPQIAEVLINEYGADPHIENNDGYSAYIKAIYDEDDDMIEYYKSINIYPNNEIIEEHINRRDQDNNGINEVEWSQLPSELYDAEEEEINEFLNNNNVSLQYRMISDNNEMNDGVMNEDEMNEEQEDIKIDN